ncbi:MAG: GreA/GreB family elongation factor [Candidatus Shapirobacteria bacterium]
MSKNQITKLGKEKLEERAVALKEELRLTYLKRREAAEEGDLKENSAYIYAGEKANMLNSQIEEVLTDLHNCLVTPKPTQTIRIEFGHKVTLLYLEDDRTMVITLVGKNDGGLVTGWVSLESPLGETLLGKRLNEEVEINGQKIRITAIEIGEI